MVWEKKAGHPRRYGTGSTSTGDGSRPRTSPPSNREDPFYPFRASSRTALATAAAESSTTTHVIPQRFFFPHPVRALESLRQEYRKWFVLARMRNNTCYLPTFLTISFPLLS